MSDFGIDDHPEPGRVVYKCLGRCGRTFISATPASARFATGRPISCCGKVSQWVRRATKEEIERENAGRRFFKPPQEVLKKEPRNPFAHLGVGRRLKKEDPQ